MTTSKKEFSVTEWGSHPDEQNDDCWTGEDFDDLPEAIEAFQVECTDPQVAYVMLDGPGFNQVRQNPHYRPSSRSRARADADAEWDRERAMQAGMAFGCDGYNDEQGW